MGRLQVHSIPAVRKLNADIKLHGIVRLAQAADLTGFGGVTLAVGT